MLGHGLAADTPALRHDAHVVTSLVLLHDPAGLGWGQAALLLPAGSRGSGL
jgi:hypothetical protein